MLLHVLFQYLSWHGVLFIANSSRNSIGCHILIATNEELIASIV